MEPEEYRRDSRRRWGAAAPAWKTHRRVIGEAAMPVALRMIDAIAPQPGHRVLELAAGTGEVGLLAAELIVPGGELICSDFAPEMLSLAQERAHELGLRNVRFKQIDAESIDLPAGSQDAVLCRWGYMLMADPEAALRETRRVLRPEGRLALAVWASAAENPWSSLIGIELVRAGALAPPEPGSPGQFAWSDPELVVERLAAAGFVDEVTVEAVDFTIAYASFDEWLATARDMSTTTRDAFQSLAPEAAAAVEAAVRDAAAEHAGADGELALPARSWVASVSA